MRKIFCAVVCAIAITVSATYGNGLTVEEQNAFDAINQMRTKVGLLPFTFSPELSEECRAWSARLRASGQLYHGASHENCARGNKCGIATFRQWYNSPGHRALLLNRTSTEAGIGSDGNYWTFRVRVKARESVTQPDDADVVPKATSTVVPKVMSVKKTKKRYRCR